ncbi:hypothetical protein K443DRAFT_103221 [Laccaria amethystina LaAM-08-1]|uniref:SMODS and SLOG-associating 2TM effector domain-containing protein n=1 Tax=Laccaria amethystina LaAM-08-1 TaxID=1095629 RepID=A0A0C9XSK7_9AGAR|nr:hypothetical protein K443DRAFT_103221 [Laccaria amethystina LaAM-08-1]
MDRPSANDEHTTSDDGPKRERPTAAAPITSSVFPSTNQEHSIPSTSTFMARHPQQPANSTQAESPPPILSNLGLSKVPATSSSTIEEKDVGDADGDEEEPRPRLFTGTSLPADIEPQRSVTLDPRASTRRPRSGIDWIVPVDEKTFRQKAIGERLDPTLITAISERDKCALKAKMTGYALNAAIGLQTAIATTVLGGLSTIVASYLARARGSNEPELSIARVKDLEQFIRECEAFKMDNGHVYGDKFDSALEGFRARFEELLGNANGLAPSLVCITIPLKGPDEIEAFLAFLMRSDMTLKRLSIVDFVPREEKLLWKIFDALPNLSHLKIDEPLQKDLWSDSTHRWLPSQRFFDYFSTPNMTSGGLPLPHLTSFKYRARWNIGLPFNSGASRLQAFSMSITDLPRSVAKMEESLVVKELCKEGMRLVFKFVEPQKHMKLGEFR